LNGEDFGGLNGEDFGGLNGEDFGGLNGEDFGGFEGLIRELVDLKSGVRGTQRCFLNMHLESSQI
jgi:hypothetical protein